MSDGKTAWPRDGKESFDQPGHEGASLGAGLASQQAQSTPHNRRRDDMKRGSHILKPLLATMAFAVVALPGLGTDTTPVAQAADKMTIEVVMKDKAYKVTGHTLPGSLTSIVLKNEDTMEHGFTSPLLDEVTVHMEGEGISLVGKGVKAYHVRPGKSLTLHFTKFSKEEPETQRFVFWCDLHPEMKGEIFVIETKGELGGG
jgi:hypothetical protein